MIFFSMSANSNRINFILCFEGKPSFGVSRLFFDLRRHDQIFGKLPQWKSGLKKERKTQLSAWSITNINNFDDKAKIKFAFTSLWVSDHYRLSYSTVKSFIFCRFFMNILPGKGNWAQKTYQTISPESYFHFSQTRPQNPESRGKSNEFLKR